MKTVIFYSCCILASVKCISEDDFSVDNSENVDESDFSIEGRGPCGDALNLCQDELSTVRIFLRTCTSDLTRTENQVTQTRRQIQACKTAKQNSIKVCQDKKAQDLAPFQSKLQTIEGCILPLQSYSVFVHDNLYKQVERVYYARSNIAIMLTVAQAQAECSKINMYLLRITPDLYTESLRLLINIGWDVNDLPVLVLSSSFDGCGKFAITIGGNTPIEEGIIPCAVGETTFARFFCIADPFCFPYLTGIKFQS